MDLARVWAAWQAEPAHQVVEEVARRLGRQFWLVGGAVRDALLGLPVADWDLAVPQAPDFAEALAAALSSRLVLLHEDLPTYRLVLKPEDGARRQLDIVELRAPTITEDLLRRDFTLNALAADPVTYALLDPAGGLADLERGLIRALGLANLQADPLRCLRSFRFHSQFGFQIDLPTRQWVREAAPGIRRVAGERVGEELLKALEPPRAADTVRLMDEYGLLSQIIPEIDAMRGVEQGRHHHLDVWGHTLDVVARLEEILLVPERYLPRNQAAIHGYLSRRHTRPVLLLTALLHDIAKPPCRKQDERGWWRFFDHDVEGARMASRVAHRLFLRREDRHLLLTLIANHLRPLQLANQQIPQDGRAPTEITMSALRRLFRDAHPDGIGLLLLALADARGCRGPATTHAFFEGLPGVIDDMLARFLEYKQRRAAQPLVSGQDLIDAGFPPGKRFGAVLAEVEDAYADGVVQSRQEALGLAAELFARNAGEATPEGESLSDIE